MLRSICNSRGVSLLEVVIAMFLTSVAIMAIFSLQPQAWRMAGRSDYLGRAAAILHKELEWNESFMMNPCNAIAAGTATNTVLVSGQAGVIPGDAAYTVQTTITNLGGNVWRVAVRVSWTANPNGISESMVVTRQERYRWPAGCL